MKRLLRWSFHGVAAASALLCVAACVLWARSYGTTQFVGWSRPVPWFGALSMAGVLRVERGDYAASAPGWNYASYPTPAPTRPGEAVGLWSEVHDRDRTGGPFRKLGFAYARIDYSPVAVRRALYLPHWSVAVLLALAPLLSLGRIAHSRRRSTLGRCLVCGYDLRATPEPGGALLDRCPECVRRAAARQRSESGPAVGRRG